MASLQQRWFMPWMVPANINGGLGSLAIPLSHRDASSMRSYYGASHAIGLLPMCPLWSIYSQHLKTALLMFSVVEMLWSLRFGAYRIQQQHCPSTEAVLMELCVYASKVGIRKTIFGYGREP